MKALISSLARNIACSIGKVGSSLSRLADRLSQLPPFRRVDRAWQKAWKGNRPLEYRFLPYVTSVLRVLGWAVLVIGVIASVFFGLQIMNDGLMIRNIELMGVGMGFSAMILGIVGSFLAWLFVLVNRELVYLFIHVKDNTKNTAGHIADESD
jgi:hypothetical protein